MKEDEIGALIKGYSLELIQDITGLSVETIQGLREQVTESK